LKSTRVKGNRSENEADASKIIDHSKFMIDIHSFLFKKLQELKIDDYYFSNTGDGHACLLWNKTHAWSILHIVCSISNYLEKRIEEYQEEHLKHWAKEYQKELSIGFGMGIHTGRSIIAQEEITNSKFAFGIVLNTAARTESFTKNFPRVNLLLTKYFKTRLENQFGFLKSPIKKNWADYDKVITPVTKFSIDTKDGRSRGHILFTIDKKNRRYFITI
jgi:hypothetical protein